MTLLRHGSLGAQETAAGALHALAKAVNNRVAIADAGGIPCLVALFEGGSDECTSQAAGALQTLVVENGPNQMAVATETVWACFADLAPTAQLTVDSDQSSHNLALLFFILNTGRNAQGWLSGRSGACHATAAQPGAGPRKPLGDRQSGGGIPQNRIPTSTLKAVS